MTVREFVSVLRGGMEYHRSRGQDDDSQLVARFYAPDDEFMGPSFRPRLLDTQTRISDEHLYGVTMFQARLCLDLLGVAMVPKAEGWG